MNEVIVRLMDLPSSVGGTTLEDENGDFNVYINSKCGYFGQLDALRHEREHIRQDDFRNKRAIKEVEGF